MEPTLTAYGAAKTVTGSCHLLTYKGTRILIDCGLYQGEAEAQNHAPFGFDPRAVEAVVVTHAHLDHIGRLPRLIREGYRGPVYATEPTLLLARPILEDALKLMLEEIHRAERKGKKAPELLWNEDDLHALYERFSPWPYYQRLAVGPFEIEFRNAGHLPGSAIVVVEVGGRRVVFSGDLGNRRKEVLPDPDYPPQADLVVSEGTYGDRNHKPLQATLEEFAQVMARALGRGGKVLIPAFAMERAQEVLFYLREFESAGRIPVHPVYVDSPLTTRVTEVFERVRGAFSFKVQQLYARGIDPFRPQRLHHTTSVEESKAINDLEGPATIIAGSGMLSGGRILHHLRHHLPDPRASLILVGYQPRGGLGRRLIDGETPIRIHGHTVPVRAEIHTLGGFSGHADRDELLDWLEVASNVVLVHGEADKLERLASGLSERKKRATLAEFGQAIPIGA